jgi:NTP pyrophosphatase (non-canonical NTP hydrolase)
MVQLLNQNELVLHIHQYFIKKSQIVGDGQDCATFTVTEAVELLECFMREKPYVRNHPDKYKDAEAKGHESAQVLMMLMLTCDVAGINLEDEFWKLVTSV